MTARAPDAATAVNPWSTAWRMKCWPTRPFEVAPHTKKVEARNQKSDVRTARRMTPGSAGGAGVGATRPDRRPAAPAPRSAGSSRSQSTTGTTRMRAMNAEHERPGAPADGDRQRRQEREEDELPGADARPEDADDEAAIADEPAVGDGRTEDARHQAAAEPGEQPEEDRELPDLARRSWRRAAPTAVTTQAGDA